MLGFKRFFNARRVLAGIELVHKIIKGQFGLPESFGTDPYMYGITCSPREGCTYLQQIPLSGSVATLSNANLRAPRFPNYVATSSQF
jgi:hypothetical protein